MDFVWTENFPIAIHVSDVGFSHQMKGIEIPETVQFVLDQRDFLADLRLLGPALPVPLVDVLPKILHDTYLPTTTS